MHPDIDAQVYDEIQTRLDGLEQEHNVRILLAVESGSRAWGFPSPDSDYDVRFIYVRPRDWYLSLEPGRDVIELPIDGLYDINGWDLKKALRLLIKPNPVLLEWLESPIHYRSDPRVRAALAELADRTLHRTPAVHHYLHLAQGHWRRHVADRKRIALKKYLYVLRPALALRWLRLNPQTRPPMDMTALRAGIDLPPKIEARIDGLIARKRESRELGDSPREVLLDALIEEEIEHALTLPTRDPARAEANLQAANATFRHLLERTPAS